MSVGVFTVSDGNTKYLQYNPDTNHVIYDDTKDYDTKGYRTDWYYYKSDSGSFQLLAKDKGHVHPNEHYLHCDDKGSCELNRKLCSKDEPRCSFVVTNSCEIKKHTDNGGCLRRDTKGYKPPRAVLDECDSGDTLKWQFGQPDYWPTATTVP